MSNIDNRLQRLIVALGSQAEAAASLGVSQQHISEVLQGRRTIGAPMSAALDAALDALDEEAS